MFPGGAKGVFFAWVYFYVWSRFILCIGTTTIFHCINEINQDVPLSFRFQPDDSLRGESRGRVTCSFPCQTNKRRGGLG
ncbi:hypothetical protein V8C34DRAFT_283133 [Trichoderma compactum]